ncbi:MAG: NAD(P)H-dependent oxidoreductase subunit E [Anaerolineae bacterium]|nr:NAD(P)H-dependent oxidoreductase subunit E [Anaerolineae bacterium]
MPLITHEPPPPAGAVLGTLHTIHAEHGYLPQQALRSAAEELSVPLSQLYSAASFYAAFGFEPRGRHLLQVCVGTACYIRGADRLLDKLESLLGVRPGETTADGAFTLETAYCFGSCSMGPVIRVDGQPHGRVRADRLARLLRPYRPAGTGEGEEEA